MNQTEKASRLPGGFSIAVNIRDLLFGMLDHSVQSGTVHNGGIHSGRVHRFGFLDLYRHLVRRIGLFLATAINHGASQKRDK